MSGSRGKVSLTEEEVERVKRAHRNDMENIYLYFFVATLYIFTEPNVTTALMCFRVFAATRILHSIVYLNQVKQSIVMIKYPNVTQHKIFPQIPQPSRAICFVIGLLVIFFMGIKVVFHFI